MSREEICELVQSICISYPSEKKNVLDDNDNVRETVINEWYRQIGFMDYEDANRILNGYLKQGKNKPPRLMNFLAPSSIKKTEEFRPPQATHQYHIVKGRLYDEEDREYGIPGEEYPFYRDERGRIFQNGKVIFE